MNEVNAPSFFLGPVSRPQSARQVWLALLALWTGVLVAWYLERAAAVLGFGLFFSAVLVLPVLLSKRHSQRGGASGWPSIWLADGRLKITNGDGLLWSKPAHDIASAEVESRKWLVFSGQALLIKSRDGDSYYLAVPKPLSPQFTLEDVARAILEHAAQARRTRQRDPA